MRPVAFLFAHVLSFQSFAWSWEASRIVCLKAALAPLRTFPFRMVAFLASSLSIGSPVLCALHLSRDAALTASLHS